MSPAPDRLLLTRGSAIGLLAVLVATLAAVETVAQPRPVSRPDSIRGHYHHWVTVGAGGGTSPGHAMLTANYSFGRGSVWQIGGSAGGSFWGREEFYELHLAGGRRTFDRPLLAAAFVGPSVARLVTAGVATPSTTSTRYAPGLMVNMQLIAVVLPELGLGFDAFGHLNVVKSVAGVRLVLYLGNDRW